MFGREQQKKEIVHLAMFPDLRLNETTGVSPLDSFVLVFQLIFSLFLLLSLSYHTNTYTSTKRNQKRNTQNTKQKIENKSPKRNQDVTEEPEELQ